MAFVYCAKRNLDHAAKTETGEIGPGAYDIPVSSIKYPKPSYAPFSTTSKRSGMLKEKSREPVDLPGPGSYNVNSSKNSGQTISLPFKSRMKRFPDSNKSAIPGPGQYKTQNMVPGGRKDFQVKQQRPKDSTYKNLLTEIFKECNPSVPSIPAPHQSFGYHADGLGRMVPQRPALRSSSQLVEDVDRAFSNTSKARKLPAPSFGISKSQRTNFARSGSEAPGPGTYDTSSRATGSNQEALQLGPPSGTVAFKSTVKRGIISERTTAQTTPGPGTYISNIPSNPVPVHESLQFFGSTSARFDGQRRVNKAPGPGHYDVPSVGVVVKTGPLPRQQRRELPGSSGNGMLSPTDNPQGFLCSSDRFSSNAPNQVPGIGEYQVPTMIDELNKKRQLAGRKGIFGSTSKRFVNGAMGSSGQLDQPGPGAYAMQANGAFNTNPVVSQKGSSGFVSSSKRSQDARRSQCPDPGSYNVNFRWDEVYNRKNKPQGFVGSTSKRFGNDSKSLAPGPGAYDNPSSAIELKAPSRKQVFITTTKRFSDAKFEHDVTPAPCDYDCSGDLNQRTYNVAFIQE